MNLGEFSAIASVEFVAVLLGVLLAFSIERRWGIKRNRKEREDLLSMLRVELKRIERILCHGNLLYPRVWQSAVSSGRLVTLFSLEDEMKLVPVYNWIEGIKYEAKRARDVREDYERAQIPEMKEAMYARLVRNNKDQMRKKKNCQNAVRKLLKDEELWGLQASVQEA